MRTHLTIQFTENPDGWFTAQVVEYPAAISQGATRADAFRNVVDALSDVLRAWERATLV